MIYNAILLEKKVLILGHALPVSLLCRHVISCCLLLCPEMQGFSHFQQGKFRPFSLSGFIRKNRHFETTSLSLCQHERYRFPVKVTLLRFDYLKETLTETNSESFIVGTVNPFFQEKCEWFVLCDLNTGTTSSARNYALFSKGHKLTLCLLGQVKYANPNPNSALSVFKSLYKTIEQMLELKCNPLESFLRQVFQVCIFVYLLKSRGRLTTTNSNTRERYWSTV